MMRRRALAQAASEMAENVSQIARYTRRAPEQQARVSSRRWHWPPWLRRVYARPVGKTGQEKPRCRPRADVGDSRRLRCREISDLMPRNARPGLAALRADESARAKAFDFRSP